MSRNERGTPFLVFCVITAALGGFLYGFHTGIISGALIFITSEFHLAAYDQGFLVSTILIGAVVGSLFSGAFADRYGRKTSLFLSAFLFLIGSLITATSDGYSYLLIGRFASGIALGVVSLVVPIYLAEISPAHRRGAIVALYQFGIAVGILISFLAGRYYAAESAWRLMFAVGLLPAVLQAALLFFITESPQWYLKHHLPERAKLAFQKLRIDHHWKTCLDPKEKSTHEGHWKTLWSPKWRYIVLIGFLLCVFQQITGINAVIYYAPLIFQSAGFASAESAISASIWIGVVNVVAAPLSVLLLDKAGRRLFLLLSTAGMMVSLFLFTLASGGVFSVSILMAYVAFFAIGIGPVTWVIVSEIYPLRIRAKAMTLAMLGSWLSNALVATVFPGLKAHLGDKGTFLLFALISALCLVFIFRCIPETKGRSLEEIEADLMK